MLRRQRYGRPSGALPSNSHARAAAPPDLDESSVALLRIDKERVTYCTAVKKCSTQGRSERTNSRSRDSDDRRLLGRGISVRVRCRSLVRKYSGALLKMTTKSEDTAKTKDVRGLVACGPNTTRCHVMTLILCNRRRGGS
jgi:hypothetical protein